MAFEYSNPVAPSIRQRAGSDCAPKQNRDLASDWAYTRCITARPAAKVAVLARDIPADRSFWMKPKRKLALARGLSWRRFLEAIWPNYLNFQLSLTSADPVIGARL